MVNIKKQAFTLVELIVVITILVILSTIAFIVIQGYTQDARNSKVISDLSNITSAIEISNIKGNSTVDSILNNNLNTSIYLTTGTFGSGINLEDGTNAGIGGINFENLNQHGVDFKDSSDPARDYIYSYASSGNIKYYQVAGEVKTSNGNPQVIIKGNYVQKANSDVLGLIAKNNGDTIGIKNGDNVYITNY